MKRIPPTMRNTAKTWNDLEGKTAIVFWKTKDKNITVGKKYAIVDHCMNRRVPFFHILNNNGHLKRVIVENRMRWWYAICEPGNDTLLTRDKLKRKWQDKS